jgi:flagellar motility protein MotE (MotC chaperone)
MEPNLVLSIGTIMSVIGLFYSWHKDSKANAREVAQLTARVDSLEARAKQTDEVLQELLRATQDIKVALARIDTKLTSLEQEFNRSLQN